MSKVRSIFIISFGIAALSLNGSASAQGVAPSPTSPNTIPEKNPTVTNNLSDKLKLSNGVIEPPDDVDPKIQGQAPDPDPHSMPVIPTPGSPRNQPNVQPK